MNWEYFIRNLSLISISFVNVAGIFWNGMNAMVARTIETYEGTMIERPISRPSISST